MYASIFITLASYREGNVLIDIFITLYDQIQVFKLPNLRYHHINDDILPCLFIPLT